MGKVVIKMDAISTKKFKCDAINVEVEEKDVPAIENLAGKLKEATGIIEDQDEELEVKDAENEALQGESDQLKDEVEQLKKDVEELKNPDSQAVKDMVEEKKELEEVADACDLPEEEKKQDSKAVKLAIIKKRSPNFDPEGKSEEYLKARYDSIKEMVLASKKGDPSLGEFNKNATKAKMDNKDEESPRDRFIRENRERNTKK